MKRHLFPLVLMLALCPGVGRGEFWLETGKTTPIKLLLANHGADRVERVVVCMKNDTPWLQIALPEGVTELEDPASPDEKDAGTTYFLIDKIPAKTDKKPIELVFNFTVLDELKSDKAADGDAGGKKAESRKTRVGQKATVSFTLWSESEDTGSDDAKAKGKQPAADADKAPPRLSAPRWKDWQARYTVRAASDRLAIEPHDMEWHFAQASRGTEDNKIFVTVKNVTEDEAKGKKPAKGETKKKSFEYLKGVVVIPRASRRFLQMDIGAAEANEASKIDDVKGYNVVKPGAEGKFTMKFQVGKKVHPGMTATVALDVRTTTLGARPCPWDPYVMLTITRAERGLPGNFEAHVYYNIEPTKKPEAGEKVAIDRRTWLPVPKGTKITVSQVYQMRGPGGAQKYVEQFVGYGNVIDDTGYVCCRVRPVGGQSRIRFRIVADTIANVVELRYKDAGTKEIIESVRIKQARAAVTPFGKRVFRSISHMFTVARDTEGRKNAQGKTEHFYRPVDNQDHNFVIGRHILMPYFGYEQHVDAKRPKGILIKWEGELSTGGHINSFYDSPTVFNSGGVLGGMGTAADQTKALFATSGGYRAEYAQELSAASNMPGLIYHNHNELLHILGALVRAQDIITELSFFQSPAPSKADAAKPKEGDAKATEPSKPRRLPGVIAYWRRKRGPEKGETGYVLMPKPMGVWRLVVQGQKADPDQQDLGLVLRGYGAAMRRYFFKSLDPDDPQWKVAQYDYTKRTTLQRAWEQGFDIFFAACVLNSPRVLNEHATEARARKLRSVDLAQVLALARQATVNNMRRTRFKRVRGADNPVAVAAGLWAAAQALSRAAVLDEILWAEDNEKGGLANFVGNVVMRKPTLLMDFMALGLCPRIERWPAATANKEGIHPGAVEIYWHPNDMADKAKVSSELVFFSSADKATQRIKLKALDKGSTRFSFGHLMNGKPGEAMLKSKMPSNGRCYWTIETKIGEKAAFAWPLQDFLAILPTYDTSTGDVNVALANGGSVDASQGSADGPITVNPNTIKSVLGGRRVLGGHVYKIGLQAGPAGAAGKFLKPVALTLAWRRDEDPGQATPGIYWFNPDTDVWELVGSKRVGGRKVRAMVSKPGAYALMLDRSPPSFGEPVEHPDPFITADEGATWRLRVPISEPADVTARIDDKAGKLVRTLLKSKRMPVGNVKVTWDGKDEKGKPVPDGVYTWRLVATDDSKLTSKPYTGTVTVFNGAVGAARGKVTLAVKSTDVPLARVLGTTLGTRCEADGSFWLIGLPPGAHTLRVSAPGLFEEERLVELKEEGGDVMVPPVTLTNVAVKDIQPSGEVFTPDGDGENDYLSLRFTMARACPLDVGVYDADGNVVTALQANKTMAKGEAVLLWRGLDERDRPQPSGWYTIRFIAHSRVEAIPQGDVKVLLDRGLVKNAHAFPYTFSPNDDGFDDELQVGYNLEDEAIVTVRILRSDGTLLKELVTDAKQKEGWTEVVWDGKGPDGKVVPDGKYRFEVRPKYLSGHASIVEGGELMADSRPPEIGEVTPLNGAIIHTGTPTIAAKVTSDLADLDPGQLKIKIDEHTVLADKYDPKTGVFSFTPKTSLGEGVHIAIAYAQDWASNYAPPKAVSFEVRLSKDAKAGAKFIDKTKPEILDLQPTKGVIVYTATPLVTARVRDTESGIDSKNIIVYFNGERVSNAVRSFIPGKSGKPWDWYYYDKAVVLFDPLQGDVRYVPIEPLKAGKNHLSLEVFDRQGNKSKRAEAIFEVVLDKQPPAITALTPADGATLAKPRVVVAAKLQDAGKSGLALDTLRFALDGKPVPLDAKMYRFDAKTGTLSLPLQAPLTRNAQHAILLTVRDRAGNICEPASSIFSIVEDGEAPRIDVISRPQSAPAAANDPVLFAAAVYDLGRSGIDPATVALTLDGKPVSANNRETAAIDGYVFSRSLLTHRFQNLKPGRHIVALGVHDKAGNQATSVMWQFETK